MAGEFARWTRAIVDLDAIAHNIRVLRQRTQPGTELMAVIKADAYGHGAVPVARACLAAGAARLAVALVEEGIELRRAGIAAPILVLGSTAPERALEAVDHHIALTVFTPELARALESAAAERGRRAKVHLKIETGMGRLGLPPGEELKSLARLCSSLRHIEIEGVFSHLALADTTDRSYVRLQQAAFETGLADLASVGVRPPMRHLANSAATLELPECHYDVVRPGISIYGYYPSPEMPRTADLRPALTWLTRVVWVKEVPADTAVGYGCTFRAAQTMRIATLPLGYADGYSRAFSNRGAVLIHGERAPIIGRVCMDQMMVDVSAIPSVSIGDEVILLGRQGGQAITADDLAEQIGTISYEILTGIGKRVPRFYQGLR